MKMFDDRRAHRDGDVGREEDVREPRLVLRGQLPHDGRADGDVHAAVRHLAHHRLVGARDRAAQRRQDHPAVRELHRARRPDVRSDRPAQRKPIRTASEPCPHRSATSARSPTRSWPTSPTMSTKFKITSEEAYATAHHCLIDTLGCGFEALVLSRLHQAARARSFPAPSCRTARRCRARRSSSTRCRPRSTSAR